MDATGVIDAAGLDSTNRVEGRDSVRPRSPFLPPASNVRPLERLGGYRLVRKLGEGGMGAVYLGEDAEGRRVAVKVLPPSAMHGEGAVERFRKEGRVLSAVRHPHVTNLLETGESDGTCYLVMEYVDGADLKGLLGEHGALPERIAVEIARDIARALAGAHAASVIHRDVKPANVLLERPTPNGDGPVIAELVASVQSGRTPHARVTDFGLARHIDQSESMQLTKTGTMVGTPYYLAPEQCTGTSDITPATDVYSLGVTLFEMLAGRPPFMADDPVKMISLHCFEEPPNLRKLNAEVGDGVARIVERCLAKAPENRYGDAADLLEDLERLLRGEANEIAIHPIVPDESGHVLETEWTWDLESAPRDLWPLVSNTERINRAVGLPGVEYETERDDDGRLRKFGSFKLGWARIRWEEHPFEWVEGRRLGVLRQFVRGPFRWFLSIVEIEPRPAGGTRLRHRVRVATRGLLGRLLANIEVNVKGRRGLDRVYGRIDAVASGRTTGSPALDPFEPPPSLPRRTRSRLEAAADRLLTLDGVDRSCVEPLIAFLSESPAQELARLRPRVLAERLSVPFDGLVRTALNACEEGLLELHWDILCPTCRVSSNIVDTLEDVRQHEHCEACDLDFAVDFGRAVELILRVHPDVREADLRTYCIGGPEHAPHVVAQVRIEPDESLALDLALEPGTYVVRGPQLPGTTAFEVDANGEGHRAHVRLAPGANEHRRPSLRTGRQSLSIENGFDRPLLVRIERTVFRDDVLTAREARGIAEFRRLFPGEILSADQLSDVSTTSLLAIGVAASGALYERWGDIGAYELIRGRLQDVRTAVAAAGGEIVREQGERLLARFPGTLVAIETALELLATDPPDDQAVPLTLGLHRGTIMATSMNGGVGYFGRTVNIALELLDLAPQPGLVLSESLGGEADVVEWVAEAGRSIESRQVTSAAGPVAIHVVTEGTRPT